jgi:hypothetical protein
MTSLVSNYFAATALQAQLTAKTNYLALHLADPTDLGDLATEMAGGEYLRQAIHHGNPSTKTVASNNSQLFPGLPAGIVTWLAVWDAIVNGHILYRLQLSPAITVLLNGQFLAAPGDVALTL